MNKIRFFDLETQYTFKEKNTDDPAKLGLSVAGVSSINNKPVQFFTEEKISKLVDVLQKSDLIFGHNLLRFDYKVLQPYVDSQVIDIATGRTFDLMLEINKKTGGSFVKLNDLSKLNLGISKSENPLKIPWMWRNGKKNKVKNYLKNDIEILRRLFNLVKRGKPLKYIHKEYGKVKGIKKVKVCIDPKLGLSTSSKPLSSRGQISQRS